MSVCVSGEFVSEGLAQALRNAKTMDPRNLLSLTAGDFVATETTPELAIDFSQLATLSETTFQQGPLKTDFFSIPWAQARDLSTTNTTILGPFFKPPQMIGEASVSHLSGKPDGTSLAAPMDLEIKSDGKSGQLVEGDWLVLDQAVERVVTRLNMAGFLSWALAFAVTGRSAWCVLGERRFESCQEIRQVNLCRVQHNSVSALWGAVTRRAAREPNFFLTEDGPFLLRSLYSADLEPWACRIKWLASSMSNVYGITLPQQFSLGAKSCLGVNCLPDAVTFVVKVVRGAHADLFAPEVIALQKMADSFPKFTFYALGYFPQNPEVKKPGPPFLLVLFYHASCICPAVVRPPSTIFFGHSGVHWFGQAPPRPSQFSASATITPFAAWWNVLCENEEGGVIFMRRGHPCSSVDLPGICEGVCRSLRLAHSVGIMHCDLRLSNVLQFGTDDFQLVDFGLSCTNTGDENSYEVMMGGSQAVGVGPRLRQLMDTRKSGLVQWTFADDYEMLLRMLGMFRLAGDPRP